jgi:hypothetical protein
VTFFLDTAFLLDAFFLAEALLATVGRVEDLLAAGFRVFDVAFFRDDFFLVTILQSSEPLKNNRRIIHTPAGV